MPVVTGADFLEIVKEHSCVLGLYPSWSCLAGRFVRGIK